MTPVDPVPPAQPSQDAFNWRERVGRIIDHAQRLKGEGVRKAVVDLLYEFDALPTAGVPPAARPPQARCTCLIPSMPSSAGGCPRHDDRTTHGPFCASDCACGLGNSPSAARPKPADPQARALLLEYRLIVQCHGDDRYSKLAEIDAVLFTAEAAAVRPHPRAPDLHQQIMNIPCRVPESLSHTWDGGYSLGHRDARHAAAELAAAQASGLVSEPSDEPPPKIRRQTFLERQYSVALAQVNRQAEKYAGLVSELRALHDSYWNRLAPEDRARPDYTETKFCRQLAALLADLAVRPQTDTTEHQE